MMAELADHQLPGAVRRSVPMAGPVCTAVLGVISSCPGQTSLLLPFFNFVSSTSLLNLFLLVAKWASITILQQKSGSIYCLSLLGKNYFLQTGLPALSTKTSAVASAGHSFALSVSLVLLSELCSAPLGLDSVSLASCRCPQEERAADQKVEGPGFCL